MGERALNGTIMPFDHELPATLEKSGQMTEFGAESSDKLRSAFDHLLHRTGTLLKLIENRVPFKESAQTV